MNEPYSWLEGEDRTRFQPYIDLSGVIDALQDEDMDFFDKHPALDQRTNELHLEADSYARELLGQQMPANLIARLQECTGELKDALRQILES